MLLSTGPSFLVRAQEPATGQAEETKDSSGQKNTDGATNPGEYLISTGDALNVNVERRPELTWRGQVNSEGNIDGLPYLKKPIYVLCLTVEKAAEAIKTEYLELIKNPSVSVKVVERSTQPAFLLGAVRTPQRFELQRDARLIELLFISGGVTDRASGDIQIFRPIPATCRDSRPGDESTSTESGSPLRIIKMRDLMAGAAGANPIIGPGDIVTVMAAEPVYVTGGVVSPQGINFRDQLTLSHAIATVGGLTSNARGSEIHIYRRKQGLTEQAVITADYNAIRKQKKPDVPLMAYDIIEVPQSGGSSGRRTWLSAAQEIITDEKRTGALPLRVLN
jgi:protein involved in polysaccharide export with SLBB domain